MYPEVKAYVEACETAKTIYRNAVAEKQAAYRAALAVAKANGLTRGICCWEWAYDETPLGKLLNDHHTALRNTRAAAETDAWKALKTAADPLVRWIAENCEDYRFEAAFVLRALPASMDELDALARENGWCGMWGGFRRQAEQAGVLSAATAPEGEVTT